MKMNCRNSGRKCISDLIIFNLYFLLLCRVTRRKISATLLQYGKEMYYIIYMEMYVDY